MTDFREYKRAQEEWQRAEAAKHNTAPEQEVGIVNDPRRILKTTFPAGEPIHLQHPKRTLEIPEIAERVEKEIDALGEAVERLGSRLEVVRANPQPNTGEKTAPGPAVSPMGVRLTRLQARVEVIREAVEAIHSTLEI
jgi:hypothetical protein